jgi:hypothetical protein
VDPQGICPEGHHVGSRGARVEAAMGSATTHPDEPEPWVYVIEELVEVGAGTNGHAAAPPRQLRPRKRSGLPTTPFEDEPADADALLRELHSLAAFEEPAPPPPPAREQAPPIEASPPPPPAPTTARPARLDRDAMTDAFAELSALDAFAREQDRAGAASNGRGVARPAVSRTSAKPGSERTTTGTSAATPPTGSGRTATDASAAMPPTGAPEPACSRDVGEDAPLPDPDELAALFASELGQQAPPPVTAPATTDVDEYGSASEQLDELFAAAVTSPTLAPRHRAGPPPDTAPASSREEPAPTDPSGRGVPAAPPTAATRSAAASEPETPVASAAPEPMDTPPAAPTPSAPPPPASLDLSSFTAKGGTARKGGRKRLFGR